MIGIILGSLVAIAKVYLKNKKKPGSPLRRFLDKLLGAVCDLYLTVIRGTPMTVSYTHLDVYKRQPYTISHRWRAVLQRTVHSGGPFPLV